MVLFRTTLSHKLVYLEQIRLPSTHLFCWCARESVSELALWCCWK